MAYAIRNKKSGQFVYTTNSLVAAMAVLKICRPSFNFEIVRL